MLSDLRHLLRSLRRSPASAVAAILSLVLTLGASAAILAVVDAVLLTPPPFTNPEAVVNLAEAPADEPNAPPRAVSYARLVAWRDRAGQLARIEANDGTNLTLTELGAAERVNAGNVTPGFLPLLGVEPAIGRPFNASDFGLPVIIVSDRFWRGKLGADHNALGRQLVLSGQSHTIIGVLPARFDRAFGNDLMRPLPISEAQASRSGFAVFGKARLADGVSPADLAAALDEVSRSSSPPSRVVVTRITDVAPGEARKMLTILTGAAALAMVMAFINLAGLLIVRSIDRRRELAVRSALGARRFEIVRQLVLESQTLVAIGIYGGIMLALWMTPAVGRLALEQFGDLAGREVSVSWRVVAALAILASACAWLCGLLPAMIATRAHAIEVLRRGVTPPPRERRLRRIFVTGEVALAFVLLVSVLLLGRSLLAVLKVDPGFEPRGVLSMHISLPSAVYPDNQRIASFYEAMLAALDDRLGAGTVSVIDEAPLTHDRGRRSVRTARAGAGRDAVVRTVSRGYFDVMRIPVRAGRVFQAIDDASAPARIVVGQSLADTLFPSAAAVGRTVWIGAPAQPAEIIGVVGDVKHRALDDPAFFTIYFSNLQVPSNSAVVVARTGRPDTETIAAVRDAVARLDSTLPVYGVHSMESRLAQSPGVPMRRVLTAAFAGFALLAIVLGGLGLFGVAAHDVAARRTELALRIALGAEPARILRGTLAQGASMAAVGLVAGGVLSLWTSRALGGMLYGTTPLDLVSAAAAAAIVMAVGIAAVFPAARRAGRIDPIGALRGE